MNKAMPTIRKGVSVIWRGCKALWVLFDGQHNSIVAVVAIAALALSFFSYRHTASLSTTTLDLQQKEFRLRNRPLINIPLVPKLQDVVPHDKGSLAMNPGYTKQLIFPVTNVSEIPAIHLSVAGEIIINGVSQQLTITRMPTLAAGDVMPCKVNMTDVMFLNGQKKLLIIKITAQYEGLSADIPGWFETFVELHFQPEVGTFSEIQSHQKAFWDQKLPGMPMSLVSEQAPGADR